MSGSNRASSVREGLHRALMALPEHMRRSVTWDQGSEICHHEDFTKSTGVPVFFCDPHSPWQRGTNENTNGLLRQYFPKTGNLAVHSAKTLRAVAAELNHRPRETMGWSTPAARFAELLDHTE